jgi:hypothetical protein
MSLRTLFAFLAAFAVAVILVLMLGRSVGG